MVPQVEHIYLATNEHLRASVVVETRNARFIKDCQARYPLHRYERLAPLMHRLRITKDAEEIEMIQKAPATSPRPASGGCWDSSSRASASGRSRPSCCTNSSAAARAGSPTRRSSAPGKNACVLHYVENDKVCQDGEMVLLDVAAEYAGWNSDLTRTVPVNGKFTKRQREVYDAVLRVFHGCNEILRPGNTPMEYQKQVDRADGARARRTSGCSPPRKRRNKGRTKRW